MYSLPRDKDQNHIYTDFKYPVSWDENIETVEV